MKTQTTTLGFLFLLISFYSGFGQSDKTSIGVLEFSFPSIKDYEASAGKDILAERLKVLYERDYNYVRSAETYVTQALLKDGRFQIVDRTDLNLIFNELELQKNENFLDGYTVEQGKSIGSDYLFKAQYFPGDRMLQLNMYSVVDGNIVGSDNVNFRRNLFGIEQFSDELKEATFRIVKKVFPERMPLVKMIKSKEVLLAGGSSHNLRKRDKLRVIRIEVLEIEGKKMERPVEIGEIEIQEVENENFSRCKITKGAKEIQELLKNGNQIYVDEHEN